MAEETITLTQRAQIRLMVLTALDRGKMLMREAAQVLGLSVRHLRRLRAAYHRHGGRSLVHGNRGRPSPRRVPNPIRARIVRLAQSTYVGVNHQHLTELLMEREQVHLSRPTVRRILRAAGIRSPRTRRPPRHRRRRERMPQAGMLVQLDGSHHPWLEDRGPRLVLLVAVDDATGTILGAIFREQEDAQGYLLVLRQVTQRYSLPLAVYTDRHGIFKRSPRAAWTLDEQLRGGPAPTQVGRALHDLGIRWIPASSPQAKGRIERLFQTLQDRLVTALRLAHILSRDDANAFLTPWVRAYNRRFAQPIPRTSAFRAWPTALNPDAVFCFKYMRTVAHDNTVALGDQLVQLLPGPRGRSYTHARVEVQERLDGTLAVAYQGQLLPSRLFTDPAPPATIRARDLQRVRPGQRLPPPKRTVARTPADHTQRAPSRPSPTHPWNRYAIEGLKRKQLQQAGVTFSLNR